MKPIPKPMETSRPETSGSLPALIELDDLRNDRGCVVHQTVIRRMLLENKLELVQYADGRGFVLTDMFNSEFSGAQYIFPPREPQIAHQVALPIAQECIVCPAQTPQQGYRLTRPMISHSQLAYLVPATAHEREEITSFYRWVKK